MDMLGALASLVRVTEAGSFSDVARERDISKAAVARQVAFLEQHFGIRLLHRTTRKLSLTGDGQMLLRLARPVLDGLENIEAVLGRQSIAPVGLVRVGVVVAASHFLAPRLPSLLASKPGLKVELVVSDRHGDMIDDRLDLAKRIGEIRGCSGGRPSDRGCGPRRCRIADLYREGEPLDPAELAGHACIVHDVGPDSDIWTFAGPQSARFVRATGIPTTVTRLIGVLARYRARTFQQVVAQVL
jgi:DNA-binding transcriptional LysR family regulator